jgi:putative CocE/NonD family hydrolase
LTVVKPDGQVINLNNGILRTSFRDSLSDPTPTTPGRPYEYQIHVWPTSYEFRAGDRIRLEISSSDYPQFAPNPNTGAPFGMDSATRTAVQTILHDEDHPSAVSLPMIAG